MSTTTPQQKPAPLTLEGHTKLIRLFFTRAHGIRVRMVGRLPEDERHGLALDQRKVARDAGTEVALAREVEQIKLNVGLPHVLERRLADVAQIEVHARFGGGEQGLVVCDGPPAWGGGVLGVGDGVVDDDLGGVGRTGVIERRRAFDAEWDLAADTLYDDSMSGLSGVALHTGTHTSTRRTNHESRGLAVALDGCRGRKSEKS